MRGGGENSTNIRKQRNRILPGARPCWRFSSRPTLEAVSGPSSKRGRMRGSKWDFGGFSPSSPRKRAFGGPISKRKRGGGILTAVVDH